MSTELIFFPNTCTLFCVCNIKPGYQSLFLEIYFAHAYLSYCHAIHHVCIGLSYRFWYHSDSISVFPPHKPTVLCGILLSSSVSVACLFSRNVTRHLSSMVSYFCVLYVYLKRAFSHHVTGERSYKTEVCLWLIEAGKLSLGLARYWILCFLALDIIVFSVTPICSIFVVLA